ncbi:hypothetical protein RDWZM_005059 [Blomia tropicalis]|uniref:Gamma-secretase subunit PEN-2 n=1 Tax=Blomia tropicalis TaxID=40697 RepID=A0A9Q0M5F4_BLOTA|nr:hypothetical protein BLOT_005471 [Blomia tropicalis]KAJ6219247.1 hypothetical protein RDWZM_005059 [Blomia tropicalis]
MDLDRMKPADRANLCRKYFFIGIFGLPFLWLINTIWFGQFAFIRKGESKRSLKLVDTQQQNTFNAQTRSQNESSGSSTVAARQRPIGQSNDTNSSSSQHRQQEQSTNDLEMFEEKQRSLNTIRRYVIFSFIGTLLWIIALGVWITIFQLKRAEWGEFGDSISFNIPRGIP